MITENIDNGNALPDQPVGPVAPSFIVDTRDDAVDLTGGSKGFDMGGAGNAAMQSPVSGIVVDIPAMDLTDEFGDAAEHVPTRCDGGLDLEKDLASMALRGNVHD